MADTPDISVVIVSHNHAAYLRACLSSLDAAHHRASLEVFLVDNASADETLRLAREEYQWVTVLENQTRRGFAANNNLALRRSRGRYALILNPDTEVLPGALDALLAFAEANPRAGICGPQLVFPDGSVQPSCRRFPSLASVIARRTPLRKWLWHSPLNERHLMADFDHASAGPVDWLLGACLLVRREFLRAVGLMDEDYYLYVEDIDWAYRAWKQGWQVVYFPEAKIVHHHLAESDRVLLSRHSWLHLRSMWRYYRKHLAPGWLRLTVQPELCP